MDDCMPYSLRSVKCARELIIYASKIFSEENRQHRAKFMSWIVYLHFIVKKLEIKMLLLLHLISINIFLMQSLLFCLHRAHLHEYSNKFSEKIPFGSAQSRFSWCTFIYTFITLSCYKLINLKMCFFFHSSSCQNFLISSGNIN